ncbi:inner membrane CreD family protein [Treponema primitia]|uniref:inner membrane CreD family protein n=1 Tax=Treponema primitia TaxID=88058 RepID=UPI00397FF29A
MHPVPYLLSGIGNAVFYLLLLSLSEQIPFYTAYLIAALAVTIMMTLYSRSLLIGSIGSFVVVALIMFLTRKLDWYGE